MAVTQITTPQIKDSAVTTAKILDTNVTFAKLLLATDPGLEDSTGTRVKVDGTTIGRGASGIFVANDGIGSAQLGILTTKGDLIGYSTVPGPVPVGANGEYLVANSAATFGIEWAAFTGLATSNFVDSEVPSGTVNGTNPTFTLANTPTTGTVHLYRNGIRQKAGSGNDYQISAATITFETGNEPQTGDLLLADYRK